MPVVASIHQEHLDLSIFAVYDGSKCDSEDVPAVIKSIALKRDHELLFALELDLPQWIQDVCKLVEIDENNNFLQVLGAALTYRHGQSTHVVKSSDEQGDKTKF